MNKIIELKSRKCAETEPFTRIFEEVDMENRTQLKAAGCIVKRIANSPSETHIYCQKTVQQVTFPAGTREEVRNENYGMTTARYRIYYLSNGQVFSEYKQGVEHASLRRSPHYEQTEG